MEESVGGWGNGLDETNDCPRSLQIIWCCCISCLSVNVSVVVECGVPTRSEIFLSCDSLSLSLSLSLCFRSLAGNSTEPSQRKETTNDNNDKIPSRTEWIASYNSISLNMHIQFFFSLLLLVLLLIWLLDATTKKPRKKKRREKLWVGDGQAHLRHLRIPPNRRSEWRSEKSVVHQASVSWTSFLLQCGVGESSRLQLCRKPNLLRIERIESSRVGRVRSMQQIANNMLRMCSHQYVLLTVIRSAFILLCYSSSSSYRLDW